MDRAERVEDSEQCRSSAPSAAKATLSGVGTEAITSPPRRRALFLQRHAGNRAVARLFAADPTRRLARQDSDEDQPEELQARSADRFDRIAGSESATILREINPAAPAFTDRPCTQNCPAAATAVQAYLRTGTITRGTCRPLGEPSGYAIDPGPEQWGVARTWAATMPLIRTATATHGTFVLVEGDRGANRPEGLTQWHYFVVLNVRGTRIVVDGFLGEIARDVDAYVGRLQTVTYTFTNQAVTATPVRRP